MIIVPHDCKIEISDMTATYIICLYLIKIGYISLKHFILQLKSHCEGIKIFFLLMIHQAELAAHVYHMSLLRDLHSNAIAASLATAR